MRRPTSPPPRRRCSGSPEAFYRDHRSVADDVWDELKRHYTEPEVLEIAWTVATYIMFGKLIYAFEVPFGEDPGHPADRHTS